MSNKKTNHKSRAFTLVEVLVAITVIAIIISMLIPALNLVQDKAAKLRQKAQFHSIEIGLEAFRADDRLGDYPQSDYDMAGTGDYCGAQKLAEALIGWDGFGFHPDSDFQADGMDVTDSVQVYDYTIQANKDERIGPLLEMDKANAVRLSSIYESVGNLDTSTFVFADRYGLAKNRSTSKKIGLPVLYYKADENKTGFDGPPQFNVYNVADNWTIMGATSPATGTQGPFVTVAGDSAEFYGLIRNLNYNNPPRAYNSQTFILQSAGPDGLYCTQDDLFNFDVPTN